MVYSDDWEIVNWMGTYQPELRNDEYYVAINASHESFWLTLLEDDIPSEDISDEDVIDKILFGYTLGREYSLEYTDRYNNSLAVYDSETFKAYVFRLDNGLWFRMSIRRLDDGVIQAEDEAVIMQMIDSILLNNRSDYHEPINLVLPSD